MFERFTKEARAVVRDATDIARERGALSVEAEHLLLAITRGENAASFALRLVALDHAALSDALAAETERSLAAVGVAAGTPRFSPFVGSPKLATSAKVALERSLRECLKRHDSHIGAVHLTLAILRPSRGTVARALEMTGCDLSDLRHALAYATDPYANP